MHDPRSRRPIRVPEQMRGKGAITPLMVVGLFFVFGIFFHMWHPAWILLLTIPLLGRKWRSLSEIVTDPLVLIIAFLVLGFVFGKWHPGWLVLLLVVVNVFVKKRR